MKKKPTPDITASTEPFITADVLSRLVPKSICESHEFCSILPFVAVYLIDVLYDGSNNQCFRVILIQN